MEACLKAPPQADLERVLGFSLDPASYRNIVKHHGGERANPPEAKLELAKAVEDQLEEDAKPSVEAGLAGTLDMLAELGGEDEPAPIADRVPECSPMKSVSAPPLSPGSPEPCMVQFAHNDIRSVC